MTLLHDLALQRLFGGLIVLLVVATVVGRLIERRTHDERAMATVRNLNARINAWWVMSVVFALAVVVVMAGSLKTDFSSLDRLKTARCRDGLVVVTATDPRFRDGIACGQPCERTGTTLPFSRVRRPTTQPCDATVEPTLPSTTTTGR